MINFEQSLNKIDKILKINVSNSGNFYHGNRPVRYVHKIQNLYYELMDEEL